MYCIYMICANQKKFYLLSQTKMIKMLFCERRWMLLKNIILEKTMKALLIANVACFLGILFQNKTLYSYL